MQRSLRRAAIAVSAIGIGAAAGADIASLEKQLDEARNAAPIVVAPFVVVKDRAKYFGNYEPRGDTVFRRGEKMHFYAEPKNLMMMKDAQGIYSVAFYVDLIVTGADGKKLEQPKFMAMELPTRSRIQDLYLNLDVSLTGAPAGKYNVQFVIHDSNSPKTAKFGQDITIK